MSDEIVDTVGEQGVLMSKIKDIPAAVMSYKLAIWQGPHASRGYKQLIIHQPVSPSFMCTCE